MQSLRDNLFLGDAMRTVSSVVLLCGLIFAQVGCNPFAPDQSIVLDVTKLDAPATIATGDALPVTLTVTVGGCKTFDHIAVVRDLSGASFTAWGRDAAKGRKDIVCPQNIEYEPHSYQLLPPYQNPFTLQVQRGRLAPLTTTVQVH